MEQVVTWLEGLLLLWIPGSLLYRSIKPAPHYDRFVHAASIIAFGLAFWPLLFLWTSTIGLHWTTSSARFFVALLTVVFIAVEVPTWPRRTRASFSLVDGALVLTVALTAFSRIAQVRNVVVPLWVDSVHHTMIVRLLVERGSIPDSYAPFIPNSSFYYHWGFHVVMAFLAWTRGWSTQGLPRLLLDYGQFLNALTPLMVYGAARVLLVKKRAALLAAVLASLVSFFPAYYVSWGRYTHLAGVLMLPALIVSLWRTSRSATIGNLVELTILSAGLALIHVRVAFFALTFAIAAGVVFVFVSRRAAMGRWAIAAIAAVILVSPWYVRMFRTPSIHRILAPSASERARWAPSNDLPPDLLWAPNNIPLMSLATGGLLGLLPIRLPIVWRVASIALWLALVFLLERTRRRVGGHNLFVVPATLAGWTGLTLLIINLDRLGLPPFHAVTNSAAIITMFLPLAIAGGGVASSAIEMVVPPARRSGAVTMIAAIFGVLGFSTMLSIINPRTILAGPADVDALRWIAKHAPADSVFAVGVQPWIGDSFVGVDGGYWISVMTDRGSILPPGLYSWVAPASDVAATNRLLNAVFSSPPADLLRVLRTAGVSHVYVGPANRAVAWRSLQSNPNVSVVYDRGGAAILRIR